MSFAEADDGTVTIAFEDIADGFIKHSSLGTIYFSAAGWYFDLLFSSGGF
jgi:hypothetical protein